MSLFLFQGSEYTEFKWISEGKNQVLKFFCQVIYYSFLLCGQSVAPQKLTYAVASGHSWWEVLIEENRYSDPYSGNLSLMRFPIPFLLKSSPYLSIKAWASQSLVTKSMLVQSPSAFCLYKSGTQRFERDCSRLPLSHYLRFCFTPAWSPALLPFFLFGAFPRPVNYPPTSRFQKPLPSFSWSVCIP